MATDSSPGPKPVNGDVESVTRINGKKHTTQGLIEIRLVGHRHRYQVRIDKTAGVPRLTELHLLPLDDRSPADIDYAAIRGVPALRLAKAAARFVAIDERGFVNAGELDEDEILRLRPDHPLNGNVLDDAHYIYVANLLITARERGLSPREYVKEKMHSSIPTVDRWIREAKRLGHLDPNWSNNNGHNVT